MSNIPQGQSKTGYREADGAVSSFDGSGSAPKGQAKTGYREVDGAKNVSKSAGGAADTLETQGRSYVENGGGSDPGVAVTKNGVNQHLERGA